MKRKRATSTDSESTPFADIVEGVGGLLAVIGVGMFSVPAALIVAGIALVVGAQVAQR